MITRLFFPVTLLFCACLMSCSTSGYQATGVTDAWLDTPPRVSQRPERLQSTLTSLNRGLPTAAHVKAIRDQQQKRLQSQPVATASPRSYRVEENPPVHYRHTYYAPNYWSGSAHKHHGKRHHGYQPKPYVRTVTKVGPSIVPQPSVPLSTRSYSGGPRILPRQGVSFVPSPPVREAQERRDHSHRGRRK